MPTLGRITKTDLSDLSWMNGWDCHQPNLSGSRFGLELAQLAYDFKTEPWINAGWTDIAIQVDRRVLSGIHIPENGADWRQSLMNQLIPKLAQRLTVLSNPITQLRGLKDESLFYDTGKAITMVKPLPDNRFVVAIGFTGTGKRPQDWISNLRFEHPEGLHEGFNDLALLYEGNAEEIQFPTAAGILGLDKLTLQDVLQECGQENSRFTLLMAGHSQGAAVLQVWTMRRLREGLQPGNLVGMGFACPTVAKGLEQEENGFPLTLFASKDDVFTRIGLCEHLGCMQLFEPDDAFRAQSYAEYWDKPLFHQMLDLMHQVHCTEDAMVMILGFLEAFEGVPRKEAGAAMAIFIKALMVERWLPMAEETVGKMLRFMRLSIARYYALLNGIAPPREEVEKARFLAQQMLIDYRAPDITTMFFETLTKTHSLSGSALGQEDLAPYSYMVVRGFHGIKPA